MADAKTVLSEILEEISRELAHKSTSGTVYSPVNVLRLAEAYAWIMSPGQAHGGSPAPKSS